MHNLMSFESTRNIHKLPLWNDELQKYLYHLVYYDVIFAELASV